MTEKPLILCSKQGTVVQSLDGNFKISRNNGNIAEGVTALSWASFAQIFGRVPVQGMKIRADLFFRMVKLSGMSVGFSLSGEVALYPTKKGPMIRTYQKDKSAHDEAFGLFLNDEGNFNLRTMPHGDGEISGHAVSYDTFEMVFGSSARDYFANEAVRIASLVGFTVAVE